MVEISNCIADGCGAPYDIEAARADTSDCRKPFFYRYCLKHRYSSEPFEAITEIRAESTTEQRKVCNEN